MADIQTLLTKILNAVYGKDVRQSIHDGIKQCYYDGKAGAIDLEARERAAAAESRMDTFTKLDGGSTAGDAELADIRVGFDGKEYETAGAAVREQIRDTHVIEVSTVEPTRDNTQMWLNPNERESWAIPEVFDDVVSFDDTWSSHKTNLEILMGGACKADVGHYFTEPVEFERISGAFYAKDGTIKESEGYEYIKITVSQYDKYLVKAYYGWDAPSALVFNVEGSLIAYYDTNKGMMKRENYSKPYIMPQNAHTLIINGHEEFTANVRKITASSAEDVFAKKGVEYILEVIKGSDHLIETECLTPENIMDNTLIQREFGDFVEYVHAKYKAAKIDVSPREVYLADCNSTYSNLSYVFFDNNGSIVECLEGDGSSKVKYFKDYLVVPDGAVSLGVSTATGTFSLKKITGISSGDSWKHLKWACVGDSLTESNERTTMNYHDYISAKTGIAVVNMGVSGSGFMRKHDSDAAYYQRISEIPLDANVVTIMGSGNDLQYDLGSPTDTSTETLCGCINTTIDNLYAILPMVQLGVITPTPWESCPPNTANDMRAYADALIEICKLRGIPCLDLYRCSGLRPWDETYKTLAYSKDDGNGVHPDETGHKIIASRIKSFLNTLIEYF